MRNPELLARRSAEIREIHMKRQKPSQSIDAPCNSRYQDARTQLENRTYRYAQLFVNSA